MPPVAASRARKAGRRFRDLLIVHGPSGCRFGYQLVRNHQGPLGQSSRVMRVSQSRFSQDKSPLQQPTRRTQRDRHFILPCLPGWVARWPKTLFARLVANMCLRWVRLVGEVRQLFFGGGVGV